MINGKRIVVVLPAYNAMKTLEKTYKEIPFDIVDDVILTDDNSTDSTVHLAKCLNIKHLIIHPENKGYGANQKTCYDMALRLKADIVIMLHPDYQYTPKLIPVMAYMISSGLYDIVIASRILGKGALAGGMPRYKYIFNRILTYLQNLLIGSKLSEFHTGYRAYTSEALGNLNYHGFSDNFIFDNQLLTKAVYQKVCIGEVSCPTHYFPEASSIGWKDGMIYGIQVLIVSVKFWLTKRKIIRNGFLNN